MFTRLSRKTRNRVAKKRARILLTSVIYGKRDLRGMSRALAGEQLMRPPALRAGAGWPSCVSVISGMRLAARGQHPSRWSPSLPRDALLLFNISRPALPFAPNTAYRPKPTSINARESITIRINNFLWFCFISFLLLCISFFDASQRLHQAFVLKADARPPGIRATASRADATPCAGIQRPAANPCTASRRAPVPRSPASPCARRTHPPGG